jgi:hypothetical protein
MTYPLSSKSDVAAIVEVLMALGVDATAKAHEHSYNMTVRIVENDFVFEPGSEEERRAIYYEGQRQLLKRLVWALSVAEKQGIENPTVSVG